MPLVLCNRLETIYPLISSNQLHAVFQLQDLAQIYSQPRGMLETSCLDTPNLKETE